MACALVVKVVPAMATPLARRVNGWPAAVMTGAGVTGVTTFDPTRSVDKPKETTVPSMVKAGSLAFRVDPAPKSLPDERVKVLLPSVKREVGVGDWAWKRFGVIEVPRIESPFERRTIGIAGTIIVSRLRVTDFPSTTRTSDGDAAWIASPWIVVEIRGD